MHQLPYIKYNRLVVFIPDGYISYDLSDSKPIELRKEYDGFTLLLSDIPYLKIYIWTGFHMIYHSQYISKICYNNRKTKILYDFKCTKPSQIVNGDTTYDL